MALLVRDSSFPDYGPSIVGVSLSLVLFATLLVAIRVSHRIRTGTFGWDDAFIIMAVLLSLGHSSIDCLCKASPEIDDMRGITDTRLKLSIDGVMAGIGKT